MNGRNTERDAAAGNQRDDTQQRVAEQLLDSDIGTDEQGDAERTLQSQSEQIEAVSAAMTAIVAQQDWRAASARLLECAVRQTCSEYGFVGIVAAGPMLRVFASDEVVSAADARRDLDKQARGLRRDLGYFELYSFDNLLGRAVTGRGIVIENDLAGTTCAGGLPFTHPPMMSFLAIPVLAGPDVVGVIGLANRPGGYEASLAGRLASLSQAISVLADAYRRVRHTRVLEEQRWLAERERRAAASRYHSLIEHAPLSILEIDSSGVVVATNGAGLAMLGVHSTIDVLGRAFDELVGPDSCARVRDALVQALAGQPAELELAATLRGEQRHYRTSIVPLRDPDGTVSRVLGIGQDITELKTARERLQRSNEQLRALATRLQSLQEQENAKLSREIHDELGQALTGLKMDVASLARDLGHAGSSVPTAPVLDRLGAVMRLIDATVRSVRRIAAGLTPAALSGLDLVDLIAWQAREFEARSRIRCEFHSPPGGVRVDAARRAAGFHIFQEILTNVARHAEATRIVVSLRAEGASVFLEARDNGRGIEEHEIAAPGALGLLGMGERARSVGGEFAIRGFSGRGTTVIVRLPAEPSHDLGTFDSQPARDDLGGPGTEED